MKNSGLRVKDLGLRLEGLGLAFKGSAHNPFRTMFGDL